MSSPRTKLALSAIPAIFLSLLLLTGCGKDGYGTNSNNNPPPPPQDNTIIISNSTFSPATITVAAAETITWRNNDSVVHTVTSDSGNELNSPVLAQGQTYQHTFSAAGTYPYHCTVHPSMHGSVTVQ